MGPTGDVMADGALISSDTELDTPTVVVGALVALVNGLLAFPIGMAVVGSAWGLVFPFVVLVGSGALLLTRGSVYEAIRLGCYSTAVLVLCLPVVGVSFEYTPSLADQVRVFARLELGAVLVAAPVAAFGYWVGKRGPAVDGS